LYIDIIIPVVDTKKGIYDCLKSLEVMSSLIGTVIIVNQSGCKLFKSETLNIKILNIEKVSASSARNLGASEASADYLFFIDDDAWLSGFNEADLVQALSDEIELIGLKRWDVKISHGMVPSIYSIPKFFIEWNIIIKRELFILLGGFCKIGAGSQHPAQSGESFILVAQFMNNYGGKHRAISSTIVNHPDLKLDLQSQKAKGYLFGLGYAIGYTFRDMPFPAKVYWITRLFYALLKRLFSGIFLQLISNGNISLHAVQILKGFRLGVSEGKHAK
jgi:glycosyltransferase involved in cell wall biosynthesis